MELVVAHLGGEACCDFPPLMACIRRFWFIRDDVPDSYSVEDSASMQLHVYCCSVEVRQKLGAEAADVFKEVANDLWDNVTGLVYDLRDAKGYWRDSDLVYEIYDKKDSQEVSQEDLRIFCEELFETLLVIHEIPFDVSKVRPLRQKRALREGIYVSRTLLLNELPGESIVNKHGYPFLLRSYEVADRFKEIAHEMFTDNWDELIADLERAESVFVSKMFLRLFGRQHLFEPVCWGEFERVVPLLIKALKEVS